MDHKVVPFDGIGLCFSGGGYRATFFDLGVISYLHKIQYKGKPLLDSVVALSTVSGGTLTGVAFGKAAQDSSFKFDEFYRSFYDTFTPENDKLLPTAVAKLENDDVWKKHPYKKRSLINAFALTYSEMEPFKGSFEVFKGPTDSALKNVCFNATDFSFGLVFRFQNGRGVFGNSPLKASELNQVKYDIQLGDIVASSSCFPMGFEPLVFPDDYYSDHSNEDYKALKLLPKFAKGVGIMDGGIADNQGIDSMMKISERSSVKDHFNLIIVNDVSSYKMQPWLQDESKIKDKTSLQNTFKNILSYFKIKPLYWVVLLVGLILFIANGFGLITGASNPWITGIGAFLTGVGLVLCILGWILNKESQKVLHWVQTAFKDNVPEALIGDIISFERLQIGLLKRMITDRATSTFKMVYDIFLKQIRRLNYEILYEDPSLEHKLITSTVYELNGQKSVYKNTSISKEVKEPPSKALQQAALIASETPTTLWWDKTDIKVKRMDNLIACGQFTTCYNLIKYVAELEGDDITSDDLKKLRKDLDADWAAFNKDPLQFV